MTRKVFLPVLVVAIAAGFWMQDASAQSNALGTVRLSRAVMADGKALPAGSYSLRVSTAPVASVVGQASDSAQWVEFVQSGEVKGRELATVVASADVKGVVDGTPPAAGSAKVELLKGGEYLRVWANHDGTHYLIHLVVGS
jgi:hypothetical protein